MPRPSAGETKEEYISRFMSSPEAKSDYPDEKQRAAVAYSMWEHRNVLENSSPGRWPKMFSCRFIEPGLVHYNDYGTINVPREALDRMAKSFIGKPVINEVHKDVEPEMYASGEADGIVSDVYVGGDGWYWADFLVWDEATQRNCMSNAYSVSCAYTVSEIDGRGGEHNNIPFSQEVKNGEYTHLAVVNNPRYEGARIVVRNSKGGKSMFNLFKNSKEKVSADNAVVEIDGKSVPVKELVELHNRQNPPAPTKISEDAIVEIDGKETSVKALADGYRAHLKNEADKAEKEKELEAKNAEEEEKKKKEDEERKNAEEKDKKEKEEKEKMENSKGSEHFNSLQAAAKLRGEPQTPRISTRADKVAEGAKRYGSAKQ